MFSCTFVLSCLVLTGSGSPDYSGTGRDLSGTESARNNQPVKINPFGLEIIPPSSGVQFYRNSIVFLGFSKNFQKMIPSHVSFGTTQAYYAIPGDSTLTDPRVFSADFMFSFPCDAISFSSDYQRMYFTAREEGGEHYKIYSSDYSVKRKGKGSWSKPGRPLDFCNGEFSCTHPALSHDGQMMVFASDRDGTAGKYDLYISRKNGEKWSAPENMGNLVNTGGDELYPFLDNQNNLYFSSDGHPGYGGLDIFVSKYNGKNWEEPVNLTGDLNTPGDDIAFTLNRQDGKTGFYTSTSGSGKKETRLCKISTGNDNASERLADLAEILIRNAEADTTFTFRKLLLAQADDIARAEMEARAAEAERAVRMEKGEKAEKALKAAKEEEARAAEAKRLAEEARAAEAKRLAEEARAAEAKRLAEEARAAEAKRLAEEARAAEAKRLAEQAKAAGASEVPANLKDVVVYRVQFLSGPAGKEIKELIVDGKSYTPFVYYYMKEYRYTVGEFTALEPARQFQSAVRKAGYPQAFVATFKNNERIR